MKFRIILLLMFISNSAYAEWQFLGETKQGVLYIDLASRQQSGNIVKAWDKIVLNKPSITGTKSQVTLKEVDCNKRTFKNIKMKTYDKNDKLNGEHNLWFDTKSKAEVGTIAYSFLVAICGY